MQEADDAKKAIQDMADHSQKWHNGTSTRCRSTETFDVLAAIQAQLNNLGREIKKVNEKVYAAQVGYELCKGPHYTKDCPLKEEGKTLEEAYYTQFASTNAAIRNQGASIKALEIQTGQISKVLQEKGSVSLPSSTKTNPRDHIKLISTTIDADTTPICSIGPSRYAVSDLQNSKLFFVPRQVTVPLPSHLYDDCYDEKEGSCGLKDLDAYSIRTTLLDDALPPKEKDLGSFTLLCYINNLCFNKAIADIRASVSVMPFLTYINLGLGKLAPTKLIVELADRTVKHPKGIAENVLVGIDKFIFPVDFIVLDIPKDIKTPLILGRPFFDKPTSNIIKRVYALSLRERMELDLEARLMGEALILNRSLDPLYGDYSELNDLNEPLKLRRNRADDLEPTIEEGEVIPMMDIFKTRNGDIIVRRSFFRESCVKTRHFDRMIAIYKGNDSVTYQMARSHPRFKHLTNAQCNKMRPLLKVSAHDELKGISHPYQKLKGFYKGVLNLGPKYIKDEKVEEWLTHGHVSVHEME
ncbi:ribonuclease H-like domain-containing protein [Tanacetum coccineum]